MRPKLTIIMPIYNTKDTLARALHSMPLSERYQIILIDDGSTDGSWRIALDWFDAHYDIMHRSSIVHRWSDNHGVAAAMNLGFSLADGDYIVSLSSDDYYLTGFLEFDPYLDGKNDLVYFDLEVNDGSVWRLTPETKDTFVGAVKFIRRAFLGDTRVPELKWEEDVPFSQALQKKNPKEVFTGIVLKRYNWPREGSLTWQKEHENNKNI